MNISKYIDSYAHKKNFYDLPCDAKTVRNLLKGEKSFSLVMQPSYDNSEYLAENIKVSVKAYTRDKDVAISVYKNFIQYLKGNGIEVSVQFPPISVSNSFERLMFIAKYLQDSRHKISDLNDLLWVSDRTVSDDIKKLRGLDDDPIQVCGRIFKIDETERGCDVINFASTAHPLFLAPNISQILVVLKGLKKMSSDPLYANYARYVAIDIWEQLSDYAKTRIHFVLSELIPEDLEWYEGLQREDDFYFHSEMQCSMDCSVALDCMKNGKSFCVEYKDSEGVRLYKDCMFICGSVFEGGFEVETEGRKIKIYYDNIVRSAYAVEDLI